jgi:hypothetical protein
VIYGFIVTITGLTDGDAAIDKAQGVNINRWTGLGMRAAGCPRSSAARQSTRAAAYGGKGTCRGVSARSGWRVNTGTLIDDRFRA